MGAKLLVHSQGIYPLPELNGIEISPGYSTDVGFNIAEIQKLSTPYGDCIKNDTLKWDPNFTYSVSPCLDMCTQGYMIERCNCKSVYQPVPEEQNDGVYCGTLPPGEDAEAIKVFYADDQCNTDVWVEFSGSQTMRDDCGCLVPCIHNTYTYTVTESRWPAPKYYDSFLTKEILSREDREDLKVYQQLWQIIDTSLENSTNYEDYDFIGENFARLNVYLRELETLKVGQKAAYPLSNLFSDIGGTLGLWVGMSILTVVEITQLIIRIGMVICGKIP